MFKSIIIFWTAVIAFTYAVEDCFDETKIKDEWAENRVQCIAAVPEGTENRVKKISDCMMKKAGFLTEDGTLHYDQVKEAYNELKARNIDHVLEEMDKCWEESGHVASVFFECWPPKVRELCPDTKRWSESL